MKCYKSLIKDAGLGMEMWYRCNIENGQNLITDDEVWSLRNTSRSTQR